MRIAFTPLEKSHFSLLLKWLQTSHVKQWWDPEIEWNSKLIEQKYGSYIKGYKLDNGLTKPMHAYIIHFNKKPIGYIQLYNAYDFPRNQPLIDLPKNLGALDIFIGEAEYLRQGIGSIAITKFLSLHASSYSNIFVDPDRANHAAIRTYKKSGFKEIFSIFPTDILPMIKALPQHPSRPTG